MRHFSVEEAISEIAAGRMVVVVDDEDRENEGDLIMAADLVTAQDINFMAAYARGLVCVSLAEERLAQLALPPMVTDATAMHGTAFTVSVDLPGEGRTGISAFDRADTVAALCDPATHPDDLARPGHIFPLAARPGGVLQRAGHTEAAHDLAVLAGRYPAGVLVEVLSEDGTMARRPELERFADEHGLAMVSVADIIAYRQRQASRIARTATAEMPTAVGSGRISVYESFVDGLQFVAVVHGDLGDGEDVLVRVHSECLTGDVLGSARCDCGAQLRAAQDRIAACGRGVLLYVRGHEGRGIGLTHKVRAYQLQDQGFDTVDANVRLGFRADQREYASAAHVLLDLGIRSVRLLTNNPVKSDEIGRHGLPVTHREPLEIRPTDGNLRYLRSKRSRMGHLLSSIDDVSADEVMG